MLTYILLAAMAVINALQLVLLIKLGRRITSAERVHERLSHFAEALTLLTDTTEQGLANVVAGLTAFGQKTATRSTTRATTRRIVTAAKKGRAVSTIAAEEALSESEIRLHLELGGAAVMLAEGNHGAVRL